MKKSLAEQRFDASIRAERAEDERARAYHLARFRLDRERYGAAPPTPPPLPPKKPTEFKPPTKYEERNGG